MADGVTVRDFLDRRERELCNRLDFARASLRQIEIELDEVRRAKSALSHHRLEAEPISTLPAFIAQQEIVYPAAIVGKIVVEEHPDSMSARAVATANPLSSQIISIKALIIRAMHSKEQFRLHGATASDIRDFIKDAFGRDIARTSLSPQISRLREEGILRSTEDGKWHLAEENEPPSGDEPDDDPELPEVGE